MPLLDVHGQPVNVIDRGAGDAVVFLHAFPLQAAMWDYQIEALEGSHRCIAIDMPGFGESPPPEVPRDASVQGWAALVDGVLDQLGIDYIEGGWPGANPKDTEFFKRAASGELALSRAVLTAFGMTRRPNADAAGDPTAYPNAGASWQPLKLYYNQTFSRARIEAFHEALTALGEESPYAEWLENWSRPERTVTTRIECAAGVERRDAALLALPFLASEEEQRGLEQALDTIYDELEADSPSRRTTPAPSTESSSRRSRCSRH